METKFTPGVPSIAPGSGVEITLYVALEVPVPERVTGVIQGNVTKAEA